jgi:hypothetical protein
VQQPCSNPSESAENHRRLSPHEYARLQVICEVRKSLEKRRTSLIRKRSLVRVQAGPLKNLAICR